MTGWRLAVWWAFVFILTWFYAYLVWEAVQIVREMM